MKLISFVTGDRRAGYGVIKDNGVVDLSCRFGERAPTLRVLLFARFAGSQIGHLQPLVKPIESGELDYEGELAVVIGKEGGRIPRERIGIRGGLRVLQRGQCAGLAAPHQSISRGQDFCRYGSLRSLAGHCR